MDTIRNTRLFRLLFGIYLLVVTLLCFAPVGVPEDCSTLFGIPTDKLAHIAMFMPFPPLAYLSLHPVASARGVWLKTLLITAAGLLFGAATELVQDFLPLRCCELQDMAADAIGILISSVSILVFRLCKVKS